ncbi:hypothetical protein MIND_00513600 [Mycena indigotica]|uniref:Uncharacterized protein n=1 Tax=Mycena indigotica TaxID=2126181 RepID=A0A8H6SXZ1_9AGAR|nr:uncharacterized protein MIND_00513600 [Mycena indigotica]KAF7307200.1 hypothetical protein MIND_00513600 [Mycena indigotica]
MAVQLLPELYELILDEVPISDLETLRACCLAASVLREPSQKRIFSYLFISEGSSGHSYAAIAAKMDAFPQLCDYCIALQIDFPGDHPREWQDKQLIAERVLRRFTKVRVVDVRADCPDSFFYDQWWLFDVLQKYTSNSLKHLKLWGLDLTPTLLAKWLGAAARITLDNVRMFEVLPAELLPPVTTTRVTKLQICDYPKGSSELLGRSEFKPYLQRVGELRQVHISEQEQLATCFSLADTLERLELYFDRMSKPMHFPICFPRLRYLFLGFRTFDVPPFMLPLIAQGVPALVELRLRFYVQKGNPANIEHYLGPQAQLLSDLDDALATHSAIKRAEWFVSLEYEAYFKRPVAKKQTALYVAAFREKLAARLPGTCRKGLLVVDGDTRYMWIDVF